MISSSITVPPLRYVGHERLGLRCNLVLSACADDPCSLQLLVLLSATGCFRRKRNRLNHGPAILLCECSLFRVLTGLSQNLGNNRKCCVPLTLPDKTAPSGAVRFQPFVYHFDFVINGAATATGCTVRHADRDRNRAAFRARQVL